METLYMVTGHAIVVLVGIALCALMAVAAGLLMGDLK